MTDQTIAFIGGGNMATSLVGGLVSDGTPPTRIWVTDPISERRAELTERFGITATADNDEAARHADIVVLAVKPQSMATATGEIASAAAAGRPLVVSIAAGIRESHLMGWLGYDAAVVRCMPNTPALLGAGATAMHANEHVSAAQRASAEAILRTAGLALWVEDEALLDAVTAVSGSGPAYFFLLMELMEEAGTSLGLDRAVARQLTLQTALGAARMAVEGEDAPGTLREKVTSPGGTTEQALLTLRDGGMQELVSRALTAARDRSVELGNATGED